MPFITPDELKNTKQYDTITVVFGRFQPPTLGHKVLFDKAVEIGNLHKTDVIIVPTSTCEKKKVTTIHKSHTIVQPKEAKELCSKFKYPLTYGQKRDLIQELYPTNVFPNHRFLNIEKDRSLNNLYGLLDYLNEEIGYIELYFVSGDERVDEFGRKINEQNDNKKKDNKTHYTKIHIIDVGKTDTGRVSRVPIDVLSKSVEVSGTIVRIAAILGLKHVFYETIKTYDGFTMEQSNHWMSILRTAMGYTQIINGDMTKETETRFLIDLLTYLYPEKQKEQEQEEKPSKRSRMRGGFYMGYLFRLLR